MANPQHGFFASVFKSNRKLKYSSFEKREKSVRMGKSLQHRTRTNNNANSHEWNLDLTTLYIAKSSIRGTINIV